jgi:hypothetical protein
MDLDLVKCFHTTDDGFQFLNALFMAGKTIESINHRLIKLLSITATKENLKFHINRLSKRYLKQTMASRQIMFNNVLSLTLMEENTLYIFKTDL